MTKQEEHHFGYSKREDIYESYIGKWVIIYASGIHTTFTGKMDSIKDGYAILNPFQGGAIKEGKLVRTIINDSSAVPLIGSSIEPTTEEYIFEYCELMNKKDGEKKELDK